MLSFSVSNLFLTVITSSDFRLLVSVCTDDGIIRKCIINYSMYRNNAC